MANYLAAVASDPRSAQPKRPPAAVGESPADNAKQQPKQQAKQPAVADQAKGAAAQAKGRRPAVTAEVRPAVPAVEDKLPEPPQPPPLALEPFEE